MYDSWISLIQLPVNVLKKCYCLFSSHCLIGPLKDEPGEKRIAFFADCFTCSDWKHHVV